MKTFLQALVLLVATMFVTAPAVAVPPYNTLNQGGPNGGINRRPFVSPYLALNNGRNAATTYFTFIRPQMAMNNAINQQGAQIQQMRQQQVRLGGPQVFGGEGFGNANSTPIRPTGYNSWFMQQAPYFQPMPQGMTMGGGGSPQMMNNNN